MCDKQCTLCMFVNTRVEVELTTFAFASGLSSVGIVCHQG